MAADRFLAEFPPISTEQWEHIIREKITGAEYASKLIWHPEEGLAVKPYYRADDLAGLSHLDAHTGTFPFVRSERASGEWRIREEIDLADTEDANRAARGAVAAGAEEIAFRGAKIESPEDLAALLANLRQIPIVFVGSEPGLVRLVMNRMTKRMHGATIATDLDPLADLDLSAELIRNAPRGFRPFVVHAGQFHEHGAGSLEEVSFALSAAVDFMAEMQQRGLPVDRVTASLSFSFAMGSEFFIQIAKIRAFRLVWARAVQSFGGVGDAASATIHARTALWNTTLYDPQTNVLRGTTEAMSAVLGGADSILVSPFDAGFRRPDESSRRLARNTQIILKQEAFFARVADPLGGAYLIEALTDSIAAKAWKLFQELETAGGYRTALATGVIASVLARRSSSREEDVACRRRVLTGTNRFADASEHASNCDGAAPFGIETRAAHPFEAIRMRTDRFTRRTGNQPRIVLAAIGDAKMRSARAQFATDFLASAGLFTSTVLLESAEKISELDAQLIVLCSSDAEYLGVAAELMPKLQLRGSPATVIVAGNPDNAAQLRNMGIADFIHLRSNAVEVLAGIQQLIGIKD